VSLLDGRPSSSKGHPARGVETNHVTTQANIYCWTAAFETLRGDVQSARRAAQKVVELAREHGLQDFAVWGALSNARARARLGDRETGVEEFREALEAYIAQGNRATCRSTKVSSPNLRRRGKM
jgi:ATP/maltotriose-dependent transcriptional regulator MalT